MKKTLQVIVVLVVLVMLLMSILPFLPVSDAATVIRAYADDTIAGMDSSFSVPRLKSGQTVYLEVERSDGATVLVTTTADKSGVVDYTLDGQYLKKSGEYRVAVKTSKNALPGPYTKFEVYPQDLDLDNISIDKGDGVVSINDSESAYITVTLRDKYLNPLPYHQLQLIASRSEDTVTAVNDHYFTDDEGTATFEISSKQPGVGHFYLYDLTLNKRLADDISVEFNGDTAELAFGGSESAEEGYDQNSFIYTLSEDGLKYVFPNFPVQVKTGTPFDFTVEVQDSNNQKKKDYTGTVHFSVPGAEVGDVVLPVDYKFTTQDEGSHTFALSLQFQKAGSYKLVVQDADNPDMLTEQSVVVGSGTGTSLFQGSGGKVEITEPKSGTYSTPSQVIQGKASPGLTVKIYDNDKEITSVNSDIQGKFTYTTPALTEGKHTFYAVSVSNSGEIISVSDDVNVTIDVSGPTVNNVVVDPASGANPEQSVTIEFTAEEALSQVVVKFEGDTTEMQPIEGSVNKYKAVIKAPKEFGSYPISLMLVDNLGNQSEAENVGQVVVGDGSEGFVAQVPRVEAYASDKKVTLMWDKPNSVQPIVRYRLYYGESPSLLNQIVDTSTDALTWYIPNLVNGKEFFFAVTAIDEKGNESPQKSVTVSAVPFPTKAEEPKQEVKQDPVAVDVVQSSPNVQGETGPEIFWLILASVIGANFVFRKRSGLCKKAQ